MFMASLIVRRFAWRVSRRATGEACRLRALSIETRKGEVRDGCGCGEGGAPVLIRFFFWGYFVKPPTTRPGC